MKGRVPPMTKIGVLTPALSQSGCHAPLYCDIPCKAVQTHLQEMLRILNQECCVMFSCFALSKPLLINQLKCSLLKQYYYKQYM